MFGFGVQIEMQGPLRDANGRFLPRALKEPIDKANFKNLGHAAASLRKAAAKSIERAPQGEASAAGQPPHTHKGAFFRRALRYDVDKQKQTAVVGFRHSVIGDVGAVHEFGESRGSETFPERPTLGPALDANAARLGSEWAGSIGT